MQGYLKYSQHWSEAGRREGSVSLLELLSSHGEPASQEGVLEGAGVGLQLQLGGPCHPCCCTRRQICQHHSRHLQPHLCTDQGNRLQAKFFMLKCSLTGRSEATSMWLAFVKEERVEGGGVSITDPFTAQTCKKPPGRASSRPQGLQLPLVDITVSCMVL